MNKITYDGNGIFKNIDFGLYGLDDIEFKESKEAIKKAFEKAYLKDLKLKLKSLGLTFKHLDYYSPNAYNFKTDSLDLCLTVTNKKLLKNAIIEKKDIINKELSENKSYDGYMSLTVSDCEEELKNLKKKDYEPDIIVLREVLNFECDQYIVFENLVYEEENE
jgi:hypothetical protein